jgi:hypothetical protein
VSQTDAANVTPQDIVKAIRDERPSTVYNLTPLRDAANGIRDAEHCRDKLDTYMVVVEPLQPHDVLGDAQER